MAKNTQVESRLNDFYLLSSTLLTEVDKITAANKGFKYGSVEVAKNAKNQNMDFQDESEVRLHINTGNFLGEYSGCSLMHLVQYLKLFCPGATQQSQQLIQFYKRSFLSRNF